MVCLAHGDCKCIDYGQGNDEASSQQESTWHSTMFSPNPCMHCHELRYLYGSGLDGYRIKLDTHYTEGDLCLMTSYTCDIRICREEDVLGGSEYGSMPPSHQWVHSAYGTANNMVCVRRTKKDGDCFKGRKGLKERICCGPGEVLLWVQDMLRPRDDEEDLRWPFGAECSAQQRRYECRRELRERRMMKKRDLQGGGPRTNADLV
ncbi:hypothetical protein B0I35DRAFT_420296, partial [Stachybotrys elegans]